MAIEDDINVNIAGDFRWNGSAATTYTVLAFHRYIGALMDDAEASGDDLVDITTLTASDRSTDQILALNGVFNIDDTLAEHLFDGSISQDSGKTLYSGLSVVGSVVAGTEIMIVQDDKILPGYWGTGINVDAPNLVIMKILVKSRVDGADINGKRIICLARELNDQFKEFPVTLGQANAVGAISTQDDLNHNKSDATLAGYTTVVNTEGFQQIDIDGTGLADGDNEYYSKWDIGSQTKNDTYEVTKFIAQRAHDADANATGGNDFVVADASINEQAQEFSATALTEKLNSCVFSLKEGGGTPQGTLIAKLYLSDDAGAGAAEPTGGVLATSEPVLVSKLTSTYADVIFRFYDNVTLTAGEDYFISISNAAADGTDFVHVEGSTSNPDDGNRAELTGAWLADSADDLEFSVQTSVLIHGRSGELMRGIDTEVVYDTGTGTFTENEIIYWGAEITMDNVIGGPFTVGEYVRFEQSGVVVNGGKVVRQQALILTIALETLTGNLGDGDQIIGIDSGATADIDTTIVDDTTSGGEGILLALDDNGAAGDFYYQLIHGGSPIDGLEIRGRSSTANADVDTTITPRVISPEFVGATTGTNMIGAYGIGFLETGGKIGSSDKFFDLSNALRVPENTVTFSVTAMVTGDRVLVGPRTGGPTILEKGQWLLDGLLNGAGETSILVKAGAEGSPIATDTPQDGTGANTRLRVQLDNGVYKRQPYTSYTAQTFAIPSTAYNVNEAADNNDVFVAYIDVAAGSDTESFSGVYDSDRNLFIRVRDGGGTPIKTFEGTGQLLITDQSIAAIRATDA